MAAQERTGASVGMRSLSIFSNCGDTSMLARGIEMSSFESAAVSTSPARHAAVAAMPTRPSAAHTPGSVASVVLLPLPFPFPSPFPLELPLVEDLGRLRIK